MVNENIQSKIEGDGRFWTSNASSVARLFQNKVMFSLKMMLIYDEHKDISFFLSALPLSPTPYRRLSHVVFVVDSTEASEGSKMLSA